MQMAGIAEAQNRYGVMEDVLSFMRHMGVWLLLSSSIVTFEHSCRDVGVGCLIDFKSQQV